MISMFLLNILLAVLWMCMLDSFDMWTLGAGLIVGYLLLGLTSRTGHGHGYGAKGWKLISFSVYFIRTLIMSNVVVAREILTPGYQMHPRIIRYPIGGLTDLQVTSLANAITLTPGTLSMDISDDNQYLYIHCMYAKERKAALAELDEMRDRMMKEVFG